MLRVVELISKGAWMGPAADTVILNFHDRHRRRMRMTGCNGVDLLLDLERATTLRDGDGLLLEDGSIVSVKASKEPLLSITCDDPIHLARIAWHLGNRHLPTQIDGSRILIRKDHVIADMVTGLGGHCLLVDDIFDPEGGAYGEGGGGHHHHHDDDGNDSGHHHHG